PTTCELGHVVALLSREPRDLCDLCKAETRRRCSSFLACYGQTSRFLHLRATPLIRTAAGCRSRCRSGAGPGGSVRCPQPRPPRIGHRPVPRSTFTSYMLTM